MAAASLKRLQLLSRKSLLRPLAVSSSSRLFSTSPTFPPVNSSLFDPDNYGSNGSPIQQWIKPSYAHETDECLKIRSDMPGVGKKEVEVLVKGNQLTVRGKREFKEELGFDWMYKATYHISADSYNLNKIKAEIKNGVLKVEVPKVKNGHKGSESGGESYVAVD
ncbi:heat shock 22 kDa protein, mitochondrial-like [Rhododendron vialii]|uniref:heat shock 22 kDa protein, mitochondrial-like n=1 Tax=Rhododendron vialii TaxID=182163 RepID=UPI00265FA7A8|nr:heat shock 22 kDa protein, mitochondrial-like [Rhododendron vialii]